MKISIPVLSKLFFLSILVGLPFFSEAQKGCKTAVGDAQFEQYKGAIQGESFSSNQMDVAKQGAQCMNTAQIKAVMALFSFEDMKLEYAKYAYPKCVDKGNYYLLNSAFSFSSSKTELNKFVNSQKPEQEPDDVKEQVVDPQPVTPKKVVVIPPPGVRPVQEPVIPNQQIVHDPKTVDITYNDSYKKAMEQMKSFFVMTFGEDNQIDNQKDEHKPTEDDSNIPAKVPRIVILSPELNQENSFIHRTKDKKTKISGVISSTVGIYEVFVNETEAVLNQNGEFFADALLAPGDNQIKIKAKDTKGQVSSIGFTIVRESGQPQPEVVKIDPPKEELKPNPNPALDAVFISEIDKDVPKLKTTNKNAIAVVIGNSKYTKAKSVEFAVNDARSVKSYLINMLGYKEGNILYYENATLGDMNTVFGTKANPKGRLFNTIKQGVSDVLIFYSGHGAPGLKDSKAYFVPVEADPNYMENSGFAVDVLYNNLKTLPAKSITFISDACFSGANVFDKISPMVIRAKEPVKDGMKNTTLLNSCTGTEVSCWQNEEKHGLFTFYLLKAMKDYEVTDTNKDRQITVGEVFASLADNNEGVPYYARRQYGLTQTPVVQGSKTRVLFKY